MMKFETQWSANADPLDDGLELSQFAGVIQTCRDLLPCEIREFRDDLVGGFVRCQITQYQISPHMSYRRLRGTSFPRSAH